jgi:hypothetical protein
MNKMSKTLHVTFDGKVLWPEEPVDLEPNAHYIVTIEREEVSSEQNPKLLGCTQQPHWSG